MIEDRHMKFDNLYNAFLNQDDEKRVQKGQKALQLLLEELKNADKDDRECAKDLKGIIALFTGADKVIQLEEYQYFNNIFNSNVTSESFMNHMNKEMKNSSVEKVDKIIDALSEEGKASACVLGLCFISSDGILTEEEKEVFEKIID